MVFRPDRTAVTAVAVFFLGTLYLALTGPWFTLLLVLPVAALVARGVGCVAVTQGSKGALVVPADEPSEVPAYDIEVVDTTGCGDAFSAGFLRGLSFASACGRLPSSAAPQRLRWRRGSGPTRGSTRSPACRSSLRPRLVAPEARSTLGA